MTDFATQRPRYLAEFVGTFALVFCGTGAIVVHNVTGGVLSHAGVAACFGLIVAVMIFALGDISGAHLNPAVTIAFVLAKRLPRAQMLPYILSQLAGAFAASALLRILFPTDSLLGATIPSGGAFQSFVLEYVLTLLLMLVIESVATGPKERGMFAALAVGGTILLEALFAGPISGASMNPARSLAPALVSGNTNHIWIYLLAPVLGALSALPLWKALKTNRNDDSPLQ